MTIETRTTVELSDIRHVEFECLTCHAKYVYPIDKFAYPPFVCGVCQPPKLLIAERGKECEDIKQLIYLINRFFENPEGYAMRFDISTAGIDRTRVDVK
jgi:hypothetical protein